MANASAQLTLDYSFGTKQATPVIKADCNLRMVKTRPLHKEDKPRISPSLEVSPVFVGIAG